MRIAVDTRELQGRPTGVGRFLAALLAQWEQLPEARTHEFIRCAPAPGAPAGTVWEQFELPRLLEAARADVLFAPGYTAPLRIRIPVVLVVHDVSFAAHPEWFSWREGARRRTLTRLAARRAARVVTISHFSKREIEAHLGVASPAISVVYPGVPADTASPDSARRTSVLYVGSVFNRRHVPELIEAVSILSRRFPGITLDLVGENRTSPHQDLEALAAQATNPAAIRLRSYVDEETLRSLYATSGVFAFLSDYEGFGLTPLEAMAAGMPVVVLDTPVSRESCGEAASYVTRPPHAATIAAALERALFDAAERNRLRSASTGVLRRYAWESAARQVLSALIEAGKGRA